MNTHKPISETIGTITGILTILAALFGIGKYIDNRYAKLEETQTKIEKTQTEQGIQQTQILLIQTNLLNIIHSLPKQVQNDIVDKSKIDETFSLDKSKYIQQNK